MRNFILALAIIGSLVPARAQQTKLLTAEKHNEYGLVYTLPVTAFEIEITAVKETKIAGPFYKYAKKYAGASDVITENSENWTVENVAVKPYGIPDADKRYVMQLKAGATTFIGVADDGMLLTVNKEPVMTASPTASFNQIEGTPATGKEYLQFVNEDFISAQSSLKQAQLLGEELMEIRDAKISLTRGTAETMPTDGRQLEIMLNSLQNQENALMQAFVGTSWKERVKRTYTFFPDDDSRKILCRLSSFNGLVAADDLSGQPVYVEVKIVEEPTLPTDQKGEEKKLPKDAVMYCIPGTAQLSLSTGGKILFEKDFQMSQFGINFGLNPAIFTDKKEPSYAVFDPATGALVELGVIK